MKYIRIDRKHILDIADVYEVPVYPGITIIEFINYRGSADYQMFKDGRTLTDEYGDEIVEAQKYIKFAHSLADFVQSQVEEESEEEEK